MEKYSDEYTSFEGISKTHEIIGTVLGVCFFVALFAFYVYDLITSTPVYSSVLGIVFFSAITFFILSNRPLKNIEVLERRICRRLDKQGYPYEKKEGTLYITKNDHRFRVHIANGYDNRIKHLYFLYEFTDDNFEKVSKEGWTRAANSINVNNTRITFITLEDYFCCCYQTAIGTSKGFIKEFEQAYQTIGEAMSDYNKIYPYIERDYPNTVSEHKTCIGFK